MIHGKKVKNPTKKELAWDIADAMGQPRPAVSNGSSVDSTFLDVIFTARTGKPTGQPDAYRKVERVLQLLDLTYDPYWDTSEAAEKGGSTVTNRAYSRIRSAVTGVPRCFLLNTTDAPTSSKWETDHTDTYEYDRTVTGRAPFTDAGPGSRVIYYSTSKSSAYPKHFISDAAVDVIESGWAGPSWTARISNYRRFETPVAADELELPGWNHQHAITEISWETFQAIVSAGNGPGAPVLPPGTDTDPGGDVVAEKILDNYPPADADLELTVPASLPTGPLAADDPVDPIYQETSNGEGLDGPPSFPRRTKADQKRNKIAEERAVLLVTKALVKGGWTLDRDRQADGVGYDLDFTKAGRALKVEVKGIQGATLQFNVTPKEYWRALTDEAFVVIAVTSVLSPTAFKINFLARDEVVKAPRTVTGYRIKI